MADSIKIKLAAREFTVRRLTLRQSRTIGIGLTRDSTDNTYAFLIDQAVEIIAAALSRDYPDMTVNTVLDAEVSPKELKTISDSILEFSGFIKTKDDSSGEATPGAA